LTPEGADKPRGEVGEAGGERLAAQNGRRNVKRTAKCLS